MKRAGRLILVISALMSAAVIATAQTSVADSYAATINNQLGQSYAYKYIELVRSGWDALRAYRSMWAYSNGWRLGYYHGWHDGAYQINRARPHPAHQRWVTDSNSAYGDWLRWHQSQPWSSEVWGSFEKGWHDGHYKGRGTGWNRRQDLPFANVPRPEAADFGAAARAARMQLDPNDPWAGLERTPMVTGPGAF